MMKKKRKKNNKVYQLKKRYKEQIKKDIINDLILSKMEIHKLALNVPVISKGDKLFVESANPGDALINNSSSNNDIIMPNGYAGASYLLLDLLKYTDNHLLCDGIAFPALFCLRHYLELVMKGSIMRFGGNSNEKTHNLKKLWINLKKQIEPFCEDLEPIDDVIREIDTIDFDGTSFKYDFKLNEKGTKINNIYNIELLQTRVLQLFGFFEGIDSLSYSVNANN